MGASGPATPEVGSGTLEGPKWRLTYWQMVSTSREPVLTLSNGGLTKMSLLTQNTVTFSGYTPKHIVSSPLLLYNEIQKTHTHWSIYCVWLLSSNLLAVQAYVSNSKEHLRIYVNFSLLPIYVFERNIYTILYSHQDFAQITAMSLLFNVSETRSFATVFCNGWA